MNYEKIIVELLARIQTLEEQVEMLIKNQNAVSEKKTYNLSTDDICDYISRLKQATKNEGKFVLVLKSGDIHKDLNLKNAMPQVCNAMRKCMGSADVVLHTTPSGNSSTIEIEYKL